MDRKDGNPHYHIRWSRVVPLNWECFSTRADAEASAELFVLQGETYAIEEQGAACQRCRDAAKAKSLRGTTKVGSALFSVRQVRRGNGCTAGQGATLNV